MQLNEETENPAYSSVTPNEENIVNPAYSTITSENSGYHYKAKSVPQKPTHEYERPTLPIANDEEIENPAYMSITSNEDNVVNPGYLATTNDNPEHHYEVIPYHTVAEQ